MPSAPPSSLVSPSVFWRVTAARAESTPAARAFLYLADGERESARFTYGELDRRARAVACRLQRTLGSAAAGERALLLLPPGLDFVVGFLGCLYAGVVAVPAYPPRPGGHRDDGRRRPGGERLATLLADARPRAVLTVAAGARRLDGLESEAAPPAYVAVDEVPVGEARGWRPPAEDPDAVAFLQYTSGSTATPRGVEVTHRNLAANQQAIQQAFDQSEDSVVVGWLPLYHDMGLVGTVLQPIWCGGTCVLMSPAAFLQRPRRWLEAIDRYRATTSGGPDFGYALAVRKIAPEERRGLDLSSWRVAFDGAEPVRAATLDAFAEAFAPAGFRRRAFLPCYGLAEATLFVSGAPPAEAPRVLELSAAALERGLARPAEEAPVPLVSCGRPGSGVEVAVVEPDTRSRRPPGAVGEVWVAGPSVARGYFGRPEESAATFGARIAGEAPGAARRWLRTGDLGFLGPGGELFVTGRRKDLIIVRGRNLYPHDLERTAEAAHPAVRPGGAAAFALPPPAGRLGEERLALAIEIDRRRELEAEVAAAAVRAAVTHAHEVAVAAVVTLRAGELPRTSSGKVRRGECRRRYATGALRPIAPPHPIPLLPARGGEGAPARTSFSGSEDPDSSDESGVASEADPAAFIARAAADLGVPVDPADPEAPLPLDSLQAMELRNRVTAELGVELPVAPFLEGASLDELAWELAAALAARGRAGSAAGTADPDLATDPEAPDPVTAGQRALWLLERLGAGRTSPYTVAFAARVAREGDAPVTADELARALEALVARHPVLRTVYAPVGGEPEARILPPGPDALDLRVLRPTADDAALRQLLAAEAERPFDLARGPIVRARIVAQPAGSADRAVAPVLLLAIHHVAVDLGSLEVILAELAALLGGAPLPPPAPPFAAFARGREELLAERFEGLRRFWADALDGAPRVLELPADRPRPAVATSAGARLPFELPAASIAAARELATRSGGTLFGVLLAAWAVLLGRLAGRDDLLVGSPAAGRTRPGFERTVGYFANLLPLRAELADAGRPATFARLLDRLRGRVARALDHQDLPFPAIVEAVAPVRDRSRHPLVQAALVLERPHRALRSAPPEAAGFILGHDGARLDLGAARLTALSLPSRAVQLDLMLVAAESDGALATALDFSTDLFDRTTVARWTRSLGVLLASAVDDPGRTVDALPLLAPAERAQLLAEWNDTAPADADRWERTVHELVAERARSAPEAVAVEAPGLVLSYGALVERARRLAALLRTAGAGPERAVAIDLARSPELVVALLATLEAGSYYVPLDGLYPPARLRAMVAATRPAVVVTRGGASVEAPDAATIDLSEIDLAGLPAPTAPPASPGPDALAYAVFTSGSTGEPKGIGAPHRAVVRLIDRPGFSRLSPGDALLQLAPVPFDASTWEIWGTLAAGARLIVTPPEPIAPGPLGRLLARHRASAVWLTTGLFHLAAEAGADRSFGSVRWVGTGGEATAPDAVRRAVAPGRTVTVFYGPTESTTFTTSTEFRAGGEMPAAGPLGRPIGGSRAYAVDVRLRPVPIGVAGELVIGGPGLARGYLGRPALTAERFVPDPVPEVGGESGGRLYRSGDLVRAGADGRLVFLGRIDDQVKVRGFRVELGEIEGALRRCPGVAEAVAVARGGALAAFVVGSRGAEAPDPGALRERLAAELPSFMVPATVTVLDAIPLGPTGKVDRAALVERLDPEEALAGGTARRPRSELERVLAGLWAEALGMPSARAATLDREASFFDLGGHSLGMARLHERLRTELGVEIPITELFDHPAVAAMARRIEARRAGSPAAAEPAEKVEPADDRAARRSAALRRRRLARERADLPVDTEETE